MTHPIDTSPEAIAALISRYTKAFGLASEAYDKGYRNAVKEMVAEIARLTAERDEARAQMAMAFEVAAKELDTHGDSAATNALGQRLCCSGEMCGCQGADVGSFLQYLIRALTPADATAALAARDAAMRNEGRGQGQPCTTDHFLRLLWNAEIMSDYAKVCRIGDWLSGDFDAALRDLEPEGGK